MAVIFPVVVFGRYVDNNGYAQTGEVVFDLQAPIAVPSSSTLSMARQIVAKLDPTGQFFVQVLCELDAGDAVALNTYEIRERVDGATMTMLHDITIVPEGGRAIDDAVLVAGQTNMTSATAAFTGDDVGAAVGSLLVPPLTTIASVGSSTSVTLSAAALQTGSGIAMWIDSSRDLATLGA